MDAIQKPGVDKWSFGLFGQLNREWVTIYRDPATKEALRRWAHRQPVLRTYNEPVEIVRDLRSLSPADKDELFSALLTFAIGPKAFAYELAARILLQLMLPKAVLLARCTWYVRDRDERDALAVAAMYEVIRTYPLDRRPVSIPGNLALDALHLIQRKLARSYREAHDREVLAGGVPDEYDRPRGPEDSNASEEVADVLVWAVERGAISATEANELASGSGYGQSQALARQIGLKPEAMRQRRKRALRKVRSVVSDYRTSDRFDLPPAA